MSVELTAEMIVEAARERGFTICGDNYLASRSRKCCAAGAAFAIQNPEAWESGGVSADQKFTFLFADYIQGEQGLGLFDGFDGVRRKDSRGPEYNHYYAVGAAVRAKVATE